MTIEFSCGNCGRVLRTTDDRAGAQARCPECSEAVVVPSAPAVTETAEETPASPPPPDSAAPSRSEDEHVDHERHRGTTVDADEDYDDDFDDDDFDDDDDDHLEDEQSHVPLPSAPLSPEEEMAARRMFHCPGCGAELPVGTMQCRACEVALSPDGRLAADGFRAFDVLSATFQMFGDNLVLCLGTFLLGVVVTGLVCLLSLSILDAGVRAVGKGDGQLLLIPLLAALVLFLLSLVWLLQLGFHRLNLQLARGEPAHAGDLFACGPWFTRGVASGLLYVSGVVLGLVLLVVPGVVVAVLFWPFQFLLLDRDTPGLTGCLSQSQTLTAGSRGQALLLLFLLTLINIAGAATFVVGLLVTIPLTTLALAVAYCRLTGYRTAADVMRAHMN